MASRGYSTEFKVGAFTVVCVGLIVAGYLVFLDGVGTGEEVYGVSLLVPSADGLWDGTPVKIAGVEVGSVTSIEVDGNRARLNLAILDTYALPVDSTAELKSSGMLGDRYIGLNLGAADARVPEGGRIELGAEPGNFDVITRQVEDVSDDVKAITAVMRRMAEDRANTDHIEATLANVDAISEELRFMAESNRKDVDAIVDAVRRLTEHLAVSAEGTTADVDEEMDKLKDATDTLDAALEDMESITSKIDEGQGTIGGLVNDRATLDALNDTIENANSVIESFSGLRAEVYYLGRVFVGSQPDDPAFFYGNPVAPNEEGGIGWSGSNTLGLELHPQEDFWWTFEINDYPQGVIRAQEHYFPETGVHWTEWTRDLDYRFTFQMSKRWWNVAFRLGVKESGGGIGATWYVARDRLQINADAFDFTFGPYPVIDDAGIPNLRLGARFEPIQHLWLETGAEQVLLGARYGYATGYVGAGFHFSDDDIKLLFATLPLGF